MIKHQLKTIQEYIKKNVDKIKIFFRLSPVKKIRQHKKTRKYKHISYRYNMIQHNDRMLYNIIKYNMIMYLLNFKEAFDFFEY